MAHVQFVGYSALQCVAVSCGAWQCVAMRCNTLQYRESLCWIRMTSTARQDARRSGKEDAGQSLFWKNASSDFTGNTIVKLERGLVGT